MRELDLNESSQIFNLDESVFSLNGMALISSKCVVKSGTRGNSTEPKFRNSFDQDTLILVFFASRRVLIVLYILLEWKRSIEGEKDK